MKLYDTQNTFLSNPYVCNPRGFLTGLSIFGALPGQTGQSGIPYDAAGNRTDFAATLAALNGPAFDFSHTLAYTYDQRDELTEESSTASGGNTAPASPTDIYDETFAYDLAYNRTAYANTLLSGSPYSYLFSADNQNDSGGFTYDGSGNPTQYNGSAAGNLAYDPEQRLTTIGTFTAHYDGDGLRDYTISGGNTIYFLYDGTSPVIEETYIASPVKTTIVEANGYADGWRERYDGTGFNAYAFDPQGNLGQEDTNSNTTYPAQNVYVFDGYGTRLLGERVSSASFTMFNQDPVQFGGQDGYYTDVATGEVQLTHRYYDAATGHFLNRDPIGYKGGENLYAYCDNNPINYSDPEGTDPPTKGPFGEPVDPTKLRIHYPDKWHAIVHYDYKVPGNAKSLNPNEKGLREYRFYPESNKWIEKTGSRESASARRMMEANKLLAKAERLNQGTLSKLARFRFFESTFAKWTIKVLKYVPEAPPNVELMLFFAPPPIPMREMQWLEKHPAATPADYQKTGQYEGSS